MTKPTAPTSALTGRPLPRPQAPAVGGIGSGNASMQRASGSRDPEGDARRALRSAEEEEAEVAGEAKDVATIEEWRGVLMEAIRTAAWRLPGEAGREPLPAQVEQVRDAPPELVKYWHGEYTVSAERQAVEEEAAAGDLATAAFRIGPDSPEYVGVRDQTRRRAIEKPLAPIDFFQLMTRGWADQVVEVRQGFGLHFRSLTTQQGLWLERLGRTRLANLSQNEVQHYFALWQVAISLHAYIVQGRRQECKPDIYVYTKEAQYDDFVKALDSLLEELVKRPHEVTQDFITQYIWFTGRVRKEAYGGDLAERLGNS